MEQISLVDQQKKKKRQTKVINFKQNILIVYTIVRNK